MSLSTSSQHSARHRIAAKTRRGVERLGGWFGSKSRSQSPSPSPTGAVGVTGLQPAGDEPAGSAPVNIAPVGTVDIPAGSIRTSTGNVDPQPDAKEPTETVPENAVSVETIVFPSAVNELIVSIPVNTVSPQPTAKEPTREIPMSNSPSNPIKQRTGGQLSSCFQQAHGNLTPTQRQALTTQGLRAEIALANKAKDDCISKQTIIERKDGTIIIVREKINSILKKVDKYAKIGDIAIQHNPEVVALVWGAARFFLQIALNDMQTFEELTSALDEIADTMFCCDIYERLYSSISLPAAQKVMEGLPKLYQACFVFIAETKIYFETPTMTRVTKGITNPFEVKFKPLMDDMEGKRKILENHARVAHEEMQHKLGEEQMEEFRKLRDQLESFHGTISSDVGKVLKSLEENKRLEILQWLSIIPCKDHHEEIKKLRFSGTGAWLFRRTPFEDWYNSDASSILWLNGKAGSGKSVLCSLVLDSLRGTTQGSTGGPVPVIFFYCNYQEESRRNARTVLNTLLKQLSAKLPDLDQDLISAFDKSKSEGHNSVSSTFTAAEALFTSAVARFQKIYVIVDALDECSEEERQILVRFFSRQLLSGGQRLKIFLTSRYTEDLNRILKDTQNYRIDADDTAEDIKPFVAARVTELIGSGEILDGKVSESLKQDLINTLTEKADGMFLWVKYQLQHICKHGNESQIRSQLEKLPRGLKETYERIWHTIQDSDDTEKTWAHRTLSWLLVATKPLSPTAMLEATSTDQFDKSINPNNQASSIKHLIRVCCNLVVLDKHENVLRFVHFSAQEFLKQQAELSSADDMVAGVCLNVLRLFPNTSEQSIYYYAALNWEEHIRKWNDIVEYRASLLQNFLFNPTTFTQWSEVRQQADYQIRQDINRLEWSSKPSPYILIAYLNLPIVLQHILGIPDLVEGRKVELSQGLVLAAWRGGFSVVELLVAANVDVNAVGGEYGTALQAAAVRENERILELLIAAGADVNAVGGEYGTALQTAAARENERIVELLVAAGANVNAVRGFYGTALQAAAVRGSERIVELLVAAGADVNAVGGEYGTALQTAAVRKNERIVELLVAAGANVNAVGGFYGTALQAAAVRGSERIVELLVAAGADMNAVGGKYGTALQAAVAGGNERIVKLLKAHSAR